MYDSVIFGREFCSHQAEWLTGTACTILGVLSTMGSQLSLFAMSILSIVRAHGIVHRSWTAPIQVGKKSLFKAFLPAVAVVIISLATALIPLMSYLDDYFVQGMYYDPDYKLFIGFPDKTRHLKILEAYFNSTIDKKNIGKVISTNMTWQDIGNMVDESRNVYHGL